MFDKLLIWIGNALMAGVLVAMSAQQVVFAQDDAEPVTESATNTEVESVVEDNVSSGGTVRVPLAGSAMSLNVGNLSAQPDSADLGLIEIGSDSNFTITLSHDGDANSPSVDIGAVEFFGRSAAEFSTSFGGFTSLLPGDSVEVDVNFTPVTPGDKSAVLSFAIEGASSPFVVLIAASAQFPLLSEIGSSDQSVDFGEVILGVDVTDTIVVSNTGSPGAPDLNIISVSISGPNANAFTTDAVSAAIEQGELLEIDVTFEDVTEGVKNAVLTIEHDGNSPVLEIPLTGRVVVPGNVPINFGQSTAEANLNKPTSLMFGPDNKLYVTQQNGTIHIFNTQRNGKNNYSLNKTDTINLVKNVQNHDDDGSVNNSVGNRQVTGLYVAGSAANPVIWVASSDPRIGGGGSGEDVDLDTNSGILHKLTKSGGKWSIQHVVRGLPRSEENHAPNGITFHDGKLLLMVGGFTNKGVPSNNFAGTSEYALSAALLEIDVSSIGNQTYDLPTLDDEDRPGTSDENDPFGGNDGKNQAKLVEDGPVQLFATGYRNAYDVLLTDAGKLYTFDNGPNFGWGDVPQGGNCSNAYRDGGVTFFDHLHLIERGSYGGHPNPVRGSKGNKFNDSDPQSPIEVAASNQECNYEEPGDDGALAIVQGSTNGLTEYTSTNFAATMKGDLLAVNFSKNTLWRFQLNANGTKVDSMEALIELEDSNAPLDVVAQGDADLYPGTLWIVDVQQSHVIVLEPSDY